MIRGAAAAAMDRGFMIGPTNWKVPAVPNGVKDFCRDFERIEEWWPEGTDRGIGCATGAASGFWVLDIDSAEALDHFLDLQSEHERVPTTSTAKTSRGWHLYFSMPAEGDVRNSAGKVAEGVDVRGSGGYIILPPSPHPSGTRYEWARGRGPEELVPASAPAWLLMVVQKPVHAEEPAVPQDLPPLDEPRGGRYVARAIELECTEVATAPEGTRNERLNAAAYSLGRFISAGEADAAGVRHALTYAARCAGLPDLEIQRTLESAFKARGAA